MKKLDVSKYNSGLAETIKVNEIIDNGTAGGECARKEKELFDMVYRWGKVGIITDEKCNAYQDLLNEITNNK